MTVRSDKNTKNYELATILNRYLNNTKELGIQYECAYRISLVFYIFCSMIKEEDHQEVYKAFNQMALDATSEGLDFIYLLISGLINVYTFPSIIEKYKHEFITAIEYIPFGSKDLEDRVTAEVKEREITKVRELINKKLDNTFIK